MIDDENKALEEIMETTIGQRKEAVKPDAGKFTLAPKYAPAAKPDGRSSLPLILSALALLVSFAALFLAFSYHAPAQAASQTEFSEIADDLKSIRDSEIIMQGRADSVSSAEADVRMDDILGSPVQVPIEIEVPLKGTVLGTSPWGSVASIPVEGKLPVKFVANISFGNATVHVNVLVPGTTDSNFTLMPSEEWKSKLGNIIEKLERMAEQP